MAKTAQPSTVNLHINLLHPQGEPLQTPQKFLRWLMNYGRFIVIVVDIIVIGCFLVRFKMDADLQSINHQIEAEQQHIKSQSTQESMIKQVHAQLKIVQTTYDNQPDWPTILNAIAINTPQNTRLTKVTIEHAQNTKNLKIKINAETNNNLEVGGYINNLKELDKDEADRDFKNVNVTNLAIDQGSLSFAIAGETNK